MKLYVCYGRHISLAWILICAHKCTAVASAPICCFVYTIRFELLVVVFIYIRWIATLISWQSMLQVCDGHMVICWKLNWYEHSGGFRHTIFRHTTICFFIYTFIFSFQWFCWKILYKCYELQLFTPQSDLFTYRPSLICILKIPKM